MKLLEFTPLEAKSEQRVYALVTVQTGHLWWKSSQRMVIFREKDDCTWRFVSTLKPLPLAQMNVLETSHSIMLEYLEASRQPESQQTVESGSQYKAVDGVKYKTVPEEDYCIGCAAEEDTTLCYALRGNCYGDRVIWIKCEE